MCEEQAKCLVKCLLVFYASILSAHLSLAVSSKRTYATFPKKNCRPDPAKIISISPEIHYSELFRATIAVCYQFYTNQCKKNIAALNVPNLS